MNGFIDSLSFIITTYLTCILAEGRASLEVIKENCSRNHLHCMLHESESCETVDDSAPFGLGRGIFDPMLLCREKTARRAC